MQNFNGNSIVILLSSIQKIMSVFKVLYLGEIVGKSGIFCVKKLLPSLRKKHKIDFVIANGEGATGGFGIGRNHSIYLHKMGIDVLTAGECVYYKKDMVPHIPRASYILRPANYPYGNPGRGWMIYTRDEQQIGVITLLGQSGFRRVHLDNPYQLVSHLIKRISEVTPLIIIDFHAATTAEKYTMFYHVDGKVSAVIGSHTKAITADEHILPGGTAVITSAGRTGSLNSVGGLDSEIEIRKFLTQVHELSKEAWQQLELQGVMLELDDQGRAVSIERMRIACEVETDDRERNSR